MILTNKTGIVKPLADAIKTLYGNHPKMDMCQYSATELLKSPKQVLLNRQHGDEVEKDLQEVIDAVLGTAWHKAIENIIVSQADDSCIVEQRFKAPIMVSTEWGDKDINLSGGVDLIYRDNTGLHIVDWKTCKLTKLDKARDGEEDDWKRQLYTYAFLIEATFGERPIDGTIYGFPKDLTNAEFSMEDPSKLKVQAIKYDLSNREYEKELLADIKTKLGDIYNVLASDTEPRECTQEEMWQNPSSFIVKKPDSTRASKVCESIKDASAFLIEKGWVGKGYMIYERPSEPKNCSTYCPGFKWCKQGQKAVRNWKDAQTRAKTFNDKGEEV